MASAIKVTCPACDGASCPECRKGRVRAFCPCGQPADLMAGPLPMCEGCAARCVLCPFRVDRFADALPFGGAGLAHTSCALSFAADPVFAGRFLEGPVAPVESDKTVVRFPQVNRSTNARSVQRMPICSRRTKELMRAAGFITVVEAAQLTGHATATLYERIEKGTLRGRRSGIFHFIELASLEAEYPQICKRAPSADGGTTEAA